MQRKPLEVSLYVGGAGAFGVFLRWLQDQLAFNEAGLVDKSVFNVLVPLFLLAAALVFRRFLREEEKQKLCVPEEFDEALFQDGRLFVLARYAISGLMVIGALWLFASSETDKLVRPLRVLALVGALTGVSFSLLLAQVGRQPQNRSLLCLLSFVPILFYAMWLVYCYRVNAINSVVWSYVLEIATVSMCMVAFFRMAGFAFQAPKPQRARFDVMITAVLCLTCLADDRYMGMHVMLLATALMLMFYNWVMMENRQEKKDKTEAKPDDGFERL